MKVMGCVAMGDFRRRGKLLAKFLSFQLLVQLLSLVVGIALVRVLSQTEYAYFTIANTLQSTLNILADCGIGISVMSIGGRVWEDRLRFGQLVNGALKLRVGLSIAVVLLVGPLYFWLLHDNGAGAWYALLLVGVVVLALGAQLTTGILDMVLRLRSQSVRLSQLDLASALIRVAILGAAYLSFLNAAVAMLSASLSLLFKNFVLRRWAAEYFDADAPPAPELQSEMAKIMRQQAPNAVFSCVQGQITIWLISIFGSVQNIAEVGALGRLALVFTPVNAIIVNIVVPRFAKIHERGELLRFYWQVLAAVGAFSLALLGVVALAPGPILWILGAQYAHLQSELMWIALSVAVSSCSAIVWALNSGKAWIGFIWLIIPTTLVTQIIAFSLLRVDTTQGAIIFGVVSAFPGLFVNGFMSYHGFRHFNDHNASQVLAARDDEIDTQP